MLKSFIKNIINRCSGPFRAEIRQLLLRDISAELQRKALQETAAYVEMHMLEVDSVASPFELLSLSLRQVEHQQGLFLEFGVFSGQTTNYIAGQVHGLIYGFDSFEGLPERWRDGFAAAHFKVVSLPEVRDNVNLIKGWFNQTLPTFLNDHPEQVGFLHIDCDLYSSTETILKALAPRIKVGAVIAFDEYFNYPGWKDGEFKAFHEFLARERFAYKYLGYNRFGEQVSVKITGRV